MTILTKLLGFLRICVRNKSILFWFTIKIISNWKHCKFSKIWGCANGNGDGNDWLVDLYRLFRMLSKEVEKSHFFSLVPYVTKPQNRMITDHITREFYGLIVHLFLATFQGSLATLVFSSCVLLCWLSLVLPGCPVVIPERRGWKGT